MSSSGSETRQRDLVIQSRCTREEVDEFKAAARDAGFATVGQLIRARCLRKTRAPKMPLEDRRELAAVLGQLGKWGSNLNQLARQANMGEPVNRQEFEELAGQVREATSLVREALRRGHQG